MTDISGLRFCEPFAHYDPDSSCWRTSEATFPWGSDEFSETWPKRGSMRNGVCYERQMSAHPTDGHESSLLPTPTANQPGGSAEQMLARKAKMADGPRSTVTDLRMVIELLPTPTARLGMPRGAQAARYTNPERSNDLDDAIAWIAGTGNISHPLSPDGSEPSDVPLPFR